MQAICTKFMPSRGARGSRIKAWAEAGSVMIPYPHHANSEDKHAEAAKALCRKFGWTGPYACGWLPGNLFVFVPLHEDGRMAMGSFTIEDSDEARAIRAKRLERL